MRDVGGFLKSGTLRDMYFKTHERPPDNIFIYIAQAQISFSYRFLSRRNVFMHTFSAIFKV